MDISTKLPLDQDRQIGGIIRRLRQARRMSQTALADKAGVTFQQIQKYEKGVNRVSAGRLVQIAAALEVPVTDLFDQGEAQSDSPGREAMKHAALYERLSPFHRQAVDVLVRALSRPEGSK